MRKETSNQFTEGLIQDLNPINTPNTVLTDALNATIITYDGNEHSLQNDRGNYPLKNCRLKPNYIPVGLKEYGDILYIVSYNPLDNHVEIGSYPSPLNIESSEDNGKDIELKSVLGSINGDENYIINYSELIKRCKSYIFTGSDEESFKIYPGDKYLIELETDSDYKYEEINYFIIDDNKVKYDVTNQIEILKDYKSVPWQIPGWLGAQYRVGTFDDFNMNIKSMVIPGFSTDESFSCNSILNFQFRISDSLYLPSVKNTEEDIKTDLSIRVIFKIGDSVLKEDIIDLKESEAEFIEWYKDSKILWVDYNSTIENLQYGDDLIIEATPVLNIITENIQRTVIYDTFTTNYSVLLNSLGSYSDFKIADELWKFYVEEETKSQLYLEYNVSGPNVTSSMIQLYWRLRDTNKTILNNWQPVENYSGISNQSIGIIDFDPNYNFNTEDMYILEFVFYDNDLDKLLNANLPDDSSLITKKLIITSELFNEFVGEYDNFNDITFDRWVGEYSKTIKIGNWNVVVNKDSVVSDYQNYDWDVASGNLVNTNTGENVLLDIDLQNLWSKNTDTHEVLNRGVIPVNKLDNILNTSVEFILGQKTEGTITVDHEITALDGELWKNAPSIKVMISPTISDGQNNDVISVYNRSDINNSSQFKVDKKTPIVIGKKKNYGYEIVAKDIKSASGLRQIEKIPLLFLYAWGYDEGMNDGIKCQLCDDGFLVKEFGEWKYSTTERNAKDQWNILQKMNSSDGKYTNAPNKLSNSILSALDEYDMAIIGIGMDVADDAIAGAFRLRHDTTVIYSSNGNSDDNENTFLYTYFVFKRSDISNTDLVFVPFNIAVTKNKDLGASGVKNWFLNYSKEDNLIDALTTVRTEVGSFMDNLFICDDKSAITTSSIIKIDTTSEPEELPICNIIIYSDRSSIWLYKNKNLLDYTVRNKLTSDLGGEEVCGRLLSGSIRQLNSVEYYSETLYDKTENTSNSEFINKDNEIQTYLNAFIEDANSSLQSGAILDQIGTRTNTRGVYLISNKNSNEKLLDRLDKNYSQGSNNQLYMDTNNLAKINVWLTDDNEGIVLGQVDKSISFNQN